MSGNENILFSESFDTYRVGGSICPTMIISLYDSNGRQMPSADCRAGHIIFAFSRERHGGACT